MTTTQNDATPTLPQELIVTLPESVGPLRRVAIATDEDDDALARVRRVALELARAHGFEVVLYDRSSDDGRTTRTRPAR